MGVVVPTVEGQTPLGTFPGVCATRALHLCTRQQKLPACISSDLTHPPCELVVERVREEPHCRKLTRNPSNVQKNSNDVMVKLRNARCCEHVS